MTLLHRSYANIKVILLNEFRFIILHRVQKRLLPTPSLYNDYNTLRIWTSKFWYKNSTTSTFSVILASLDNPDICSDGAFKNVISVRFVSGDLRTASGQHIWQIHQLSYRACHERCNGSPPVYCRQQRKCTVKLLRIVHIRDWFMTL